MQERGRRKKDHETRKREILDTAETFFLTEGYENTSIQAIIDSIGIAKGTFYHYFSSKEELLQEWLIKEIEGIIDHLRAVSEQTELSVTKRLTKMYSSTAQWKIAKKKAVLPAVSMFYDDRNIVLREKLNSYALQGAYPIYAKLIEEGNRLGEFPKPFPYPDVAAKLILGMGIALGEEMAGDFNMLQEHPENIEKITRHMKGLEYAFQRILGVDDGSFQLYRYDLLKQMADGKIEGEKGDTGT